MTLQEFIDYRLKQNNFIHDFSLGALLTYHKIDELYEYDDRVMLEKDCIIFSPKKNICNIFLYKDLGVSRGKRHEDIKYNISSSTPLEYFGKPKAKHKEVFYKLDDISGHTGDKKYHSYSKPINIIENRPDLDITLSDIAESSALKELHNEWAQYKLSLPKTHRISFPTARYRNTLKELPIPMYRKAIYIKGQLYGYIIFSIENRVAFELSFVSLYWKPEFKILNGLNQYIFSYCLIDMARQGVRFCNSGYGLNKDLKMFKQMSQEAREVIRYTYG